MGMLQEHLSSNACCANSHAKKLIKIGCQGALHDQPQLQLTHGVQGC